MNNETTLTIARQIAAPPAAVWNAWSVPANLEKWWIPAPIACRVVTLDLRPGGGFETQMREEGGADFQPHVEGCFLEAIPEQRLVFTTMLKEGWQPAEPWLALTAILTFEVKNGGTLYTSRVLHKTAEDSRKHDEMGFYEGWGAALGQLAALLER